MSKQSSLHTNKTDVTQDKNTEHPLTIHDKKSEKSMKDFEQNEIIKIRKETALKIAAEKNKPQT